VSWIGFGCVLGGPVLGLVLRAVLPAHHLTTESKDVVKVGTGLIATMAALVLGLLVASAKGSFDTQRSEVMQLSGNVILLDRVLAHYGPEAKESREVLRRVVVAALDRLWPQNGAQAAQEQQKFAGEALYEKIQGLAPKNEAQRTLQVQALKISIDLAQTRWLMSAQKGSAIPMPFLVVLVFWLSIIFTSFGLFAPANATVIVTLLVCALSVSGAIFLILELDRPFEGFIQISSGPLRDALAQLGQ